MSFIAALWGLVKDWISGVVTSVAAFFAGAWWQRERSKREAVEDRLKDIEDAKEIHERLASDDDYAKRVRDEYR